MTFNYVPDIAEADEDGAAVADEKPAVDLERQNRELSGIIAEMARQIAELQRNPPPPAPRAESRGDFTNFHTLYTKVDIEKFNGQMERYKELVSAPEHIAEVEKADAEYLQNIINYSYRRCGALRKDLEMAGWDRYKNFTANQEQEKIRYACLSFVSQAINDKYFSSIMLLHGRSGTGKTYYGLSMIKNLCMTEKPRLMVRRVKVERDENGNEIGEREVLEDSGVTSFYRGHYLTSELICNAVYGRGFESRDEKASVVAIAKGCAFLVIDEVGRTIESKLRERQALFSVLNTRQNKYLPTVLLSNLNDKELNELLGDGILSRIGAGYRYCTDGLDCMRAGKLAEARR